MAGGWSASGGATGTSGTTRSPVSLRWRASRTRTFIPRRWLRFSDRRSSNRSNRDALHCHDSPHGNGLQRGCARPAGVCRHRHDGRACPPADRRGRRGPSGSPARIGADGPRADEPAGVFHRRQHGRGVLHMGRSGGRRAGVVCSGNRHHHETTNQEETTMIRIPVLRWGEPYQSMEVDPVVHFDSGEILAEVSRANGGLVERDMRQARRARDVLREIPIADLLMMMKKAGELYVKADLPLGDGTQSPDQFVRMQSATTGLPEHMCRFNMEKNQFVLQNMDKILDSLTRGLDLNILTRGYGVEARGVPVSYQAQSPVLG